jgi:hypothetical protein
MNEDQEPKYSCELIFPVGTDLSILKEAARLAATGKWGESVPKACKSPFRDGDIDREGKVGYEGCTFISARSKAKPKVVVGKDMQPSMDEDDLYSGCVVRVSVTAFAYDKGGNKGVAFFLNNVWKIKDGERIGGGASAQEEFSAVDVDPASFGENTPF